MSNINDTLREDGRFAVTFFDIEDVDKAINDEFLVNKITGEIYYKNKLGEVIRAGGGGGGLDIKKFHIHVGQPDDTFTIPVAVYDTDFVLAILNSVTPHQDLDYVVEDNKIVFTEVIEEGDIFGIIFRHTIEGKDGSVNAAVLEPGSITEELLSPELIQKLSTIVGSGGSSTIISETVPEQTTGSMWIQPTKEQTFGEGIVSVTQPTVNQAIGALWVQPTNGGGL